ncbi:hypothetical protein JUJ52_03345 [Virgibacillus sp. AGTR]|uniref:hypothetical protein n=1 Tax=Virgibacillus sp. AGTR TaxID=2812055 RepID=UPI001D1602A8|nr:hypothetical protein [Virgibacillus sp. AGTR]MCC2248993.1 hypothetical protein [Virgibacillus sp. AGTR]
MRFLQKMIPRAIFMNCLAIIAVLLVLIPIGKVLAEEGDGGVVDLSLYQRASELTREFATAIAPGSEAERLYMLEKTTDDGLLVAGNAGAFLGYAEILSDDTGIVGWLMSSYTSASATITYDQLKNVIDVEGSAYTSNPFFIYAGYGEMLTEMGLISTIRPGIGSIGRMLATGIVLMVYLLANAAPFLFRGALMILTTLNPFKLFETVINGTASADLGIISGVAEYVGSIYQTVQDFSVMFLLPIFLVTTVFGILVFRKTSVVKGFGRYGVRVFMLFAGIPLIGATYTGLVEDLESQVAVGTEYADYLVLSSYVDFEGWVKYSRLAPPKDSGIRNPRYGDDETRTISNRELILDINGKRANNDRAYALQDRYSSTSNIGAIFEEGGNQKNVDTEDRSGQEISSFSEVFNILSRHMTSARYTSSDYSGEVSGQVQKILANSNNEADEENIMKMFTLSSSDSRTWGEKLNPFNQEKDWMKPIRWNGKGNNVDSSAKGLFTEGDALNPLFQFGRFHMNIYNSGDLRYDRFKGYVSPAMPDVVNGKTAPIGEDREGTVGGLSPIALYNFLNTTFSNTGLTVYSPEKTSSDLSRDAYAAVTFGGSGMSSVTRWIENLTVMLSLAVLSIAYGVMMISVAIKNIPRILTGVFGTALGSIAFTTKLLISTAVLIIQIIGMIFLYTLSENIIMSMLLNFNELVDTGGEYFGSGLIFDFLGSFLITVITAAVTFFMIKNMKVFKELMEEVVTNAINRVMGALDTSTGGQGLDVSKSSGGRVGGDGKLTDKAREPMTNVGRMLGAAHDLESRREQMGEELGHDKPGLGVKIKNRLGTASDLMGAKGKDTMKGLAGVEGKSLEREMQAKERKINSMPYRKDAQDGNVAGATSMGQAIDENGEILTDSNGNALDTNGNSVSPSSPVAMAGTTAMTAEDGALMDTDGNTYTDEMGNAFYQNEKGQLVDKVGNFVALDKDGTLQPVTEIPGHNGKAVSASKEAKKLDSMRFDADSYDAMTNEKDATHYGLDKDGNAIGTNGEALQVNGSNGSQPVRLDEQGFVTDADGNRVSASDIHGSVDARGFDKVEGDDGNTYLKHKGDAAMKHVAVPGKGKTESQNLTSLAKQSNRANALAKRANERVKQLKANGASPYASMQAQRYADKANKNARVSQQSFNQAMQANGKPTTGFARQPVTDEFVQSAARHANAEKMALDENIDKLEQMKAKGAPQKMIARQERKVDGQRHAVHQAAGVEQDLRTAKAAGRSYNEVHSARSRVESAEQLYVKAQNAHTEAVNSGQPKEVIQKRERKMNQALNAVSAAQANLSRVSQKPSGTPEQIDHATARYEQAKAQHSQATNRSEQVQAKRRMDKAQSIKQRFLNPPGWSKNSSDVPQVKSVPTRSASKSYAELTASGVSNYDDYRKQVKKHTTDLKTNQSKLKQAQQRLVTLRSSNRPPQIIDQAENQVATLQNSVNASQSNVKRLKDNAQGLLKNGDFQPVVASRPIRKNGSAIINQMVHLSHSQSMYDKLSQQEQTGTITKAGRKQMKSLGGRLSHMKRDLIRSGIREDSIKDKTSIVQSTKHMQQSWESFVNGTSIENNDE